MQTKQLLGKSTSWHIQIKASTETIIFFVCHRNFPTGIKSLFYDDAFFIVTPASSHHLKICTPASQFSFGSFSYFLASLRSLSFFGNSKILLLHMVCVCRSLTRSLSFAGLDLQKADRGQTGTGTHKHKPVFK